MDELVAVGNELVGHVLRECFKLTQKKRETFLRIEGRPQKLRIEYMIDPESPTTLGRVIIKNNRIISDYEFPAQRGALDIIPPKSHFEFLKYLQENTGGRIIDGEVSRYRTGRGLWTDSP